MRENDRNKFVDLAEKRVSKALRDIQLIGKGITSNSDEIAPDPA